MYKASYLMRRPIAYKDGQLSNGGGPFTINKASYIIEEAHCL